VLGAICLVNNLLACTRHRLPKASETAVKEAIAAATGKAVGAFYLTGGRSEIISLSWDALTDGAQYTVKAYTAPDRQPQPDLNAHNHEHEHEHEHDRGSRDASAAVLGLGSAGSQQPLHDGAVVLTQKPARLPRVVLACLGTARYRGIAISALESARDKFGGDSLVSLHLLTDNVSGVDPLFNPAYAPQVPFRSSFPRKIPPLQSLQVLSPL